MCRERSQSVVVEALLQLSLAASTVGLLARVCRVAFTTPQKALLEPFPEASVVARLVALFSARAAAQQDHRQERHAPSDDALH